MALKSLLNPDSGPKPETPNPNIELSALVVVVVTGGVEVGATERLAMLASGANVGRSAGKSDGADVLGGTEVAGVVVEVVGRATVCCLRTEGGIMLEVSSLGRSLPRTFSAIRNIANANCSAFSLPFFRTSHKFLQWTTRS